MFIIGTVINLLHCIVVVYFIIVYRYMPCAHHLSYVETSVANTTVHFSQELHKTATRQTNKLAPEPLNTSEIRRSSPLTDIQYTVPYTALPHLVLLVFVGDFERLGGTDHGLHRREDVLVDQLDEAALVFVRVAGAMDDAHLFDKCALAALSCTYTNRGQRSGLKILLL